MGAGNWEEDGRDENDPIGEGEELVNDPDGWPLLPAMGHQSLEECKIILRLYVMANYCKPHTHWIQGQALTSG